MTAVLSLSAAGSVLSWWVLGNRDSGEDTIFRALDDVILAPWIQPTVVVGSGVLAALALVVLVVPGLRRGPAVATWTAGLLFVDAVFAGVAWRFMTVRTDGMNVFAAVLALLAPLIVAALLAAAVVVETRRRRLPWLATAAGVVLGLALGVGLEMVLLRLA